MGLDRAPIEFVMLVFLTPGNPKPKPGKWGIPEKLLESNSGMLISGR